MLSSKEIKDLLIERFPYEPTTGQLKLIEMLTAFIIKKDKQSVFIIKGYAGTGKTTIVSALVNTLPFLKLKSVLLAPTGKAAKVLANYSKKQAFTIHKKIYRISISKEGFVSFNLQENKHTNTIFIVDEASMISNESSSSENNLFSSRNILDDLFQYVFNGDNCKLILIGDTAQLPPVKLSLSPALNLQYLNRTYDLNAEATELTDVVRQSENSGILFNATLLRKIINQKKNQKIKFVLNKEGDFIRLNGADFEDAIQSAYSNTGIENTVIICRSNKRANLFNQGIRNKILLKDSEIAVGDLLMVVKNNYYWLPKESKVGFIANGDTVEIVKILKYQEIYGFRFAKILVRFLDYEDELNIELHIILNTLSSETPSLSLDENKKLYEEVGKDYDDIANKRQKLEKIKNNPYFNALQVKFAYSLTCHKAQGGQWDTVFVEQGYITDDMINTEYYRWLYTAITRAQSKLYLVNFDDDFFAIKKT